MSFDVKVTTNFKERELRLAGFNTMGKSAFEIGLIVQSLAKPLVPVDTGRLRGSITTQARDHGTAMEGGQSGDRIQSPTDPLEVLVGTAVFYSPYIEYGTIRRGAQPFMRPALEQVRGKTQSILAKNSRAEFKDFA